MSSKPNTFLGLLILGFLFSFLHTGNALKCYNCSTKTDPECGALNVSDKYLLDCPEDGEQKYTMCRKIVQRIDFNVNQNVAETRIIRKCGWYSSGYDGKCYLRTGFGGRQEVCSCLTDKCNGATSLSSTFFLPVLVMLIIHIFRHIV